VKQLLLLLVGSLLLLTTLSTPMKADGGPKPHCPPGTDMCKP
jgi:hypothetical protein